MDYHTTDETVELKLECARVALLGGYTPTQTMLTAFDLYDWCVAPEEDSTEQIDISQMN